MSLKTTITDGKGSNGTASVQTKRDESGLVVYSHPLREFSPESTPFFNPDNGIEMAISGGFSGTPELVHNGGDTAAWTGSNIIGSSVDFASTTRPRTGTFSVRANSPSLGDVWQFDKGSNIDLSNYVALTIWINVNRRWGAGDSVNIFGYDTGTGLQVGNSVNIQDYINETDFDVWQEAVIPLSDMGLNSSTVDAIRMSINAAAGQTPDFYIDDFDVQESTTSVSYTLEPEQGRILYLNELRFNFVDAYDASLLNNSMYNLSYNQILGQAKLNAGIQLQRFKQGEIQFSAIFTCLNDFLRVGIGIDQAISDGTNTSIVLKRIFTEFFELDSRQEDKLVITINDNLSGLISFSVFGLGKEEIVE